MQPRDIAPYIAWKINETIDLILGTLSTEYTQSAFTHASRIFHRVFNDNDNDNRTSHFQCCVHQLQELGSSSQMMATE